MIEDPRESFGKIDINRNSFQDEIVRIKFVIGETYEKIRIEDWLALLFRLYEYLEKSQGNNSNAQMGILSILSHITSIEIFRNFIRFPEAFVSMHLHFLDTSCQKPKVSILELLALDTSKSAAILDNIYTLYELYDKLSDEQVTDIIQSSAVLGNHVIGVDVLSIEQARKHAFLFLNRLHNYCTFFSATIQFFRSSIDADSFLPTDGDFHNGGKSPIFFEYTENSEKKKCVYKPRDIASDYLIAHCMEVFQELLPEPDNSDPTKLIPNPLKWKISTPFELNPGFWIIPFETKVDDMTSEEAEVYFSRLGALLCFAKLFGLYDLHRENIISTTDGPVIIDAECVFSKEIITTKKFTPMGISELFSGFINFPIENIGFTVRGNIIILSAFKKSFLNGFTGVCKILLNNVSVLSNIYAETMRQPFTCRWVPVPTKYLNADIFSYIESSNQNIKDEIVNSVLQKIADKIQTELKIPIDDKCLQLIAQKLECDFFNGDIPIFTIFHSGDGCCRLWMDGEIFLGLPENYFASSDEFLDNLKWLARFSRLSGNEENEENENTIRERELVAEEWENILGHFFNN